MRRLLPVLPLAGILLWGCGGPEPAAVDPAAGVESWPVTGRVEAVESEGTVLRVSHREIEGYMPAMTMPFAVGEAAIPVRAREGDLVSFTLHVAESSSWIDGIEVVGRAAGGAGSDGGSPLALLVPGDPLPPCSFVDQSGRAVSLEDHRGSVLALTFIYTRCPLPDFCPRMSVHFQMACQLLEQEADLPSWRLFSLSFDPEFDTPEVLRRYSSAFSCVPARWDFLTGEREEIDALARQVGLSLSRTEGSLVDWDHSLRTVIVDPGGRLHRVLIGNQWEPRDLADAMKAAWKSPLSAGDGAPGAGDGQGDAGIHDVYE